MQYIVGLCAVYFCKHGHGYRLQASNYIQMGFRASAGWRFCTVTKGLVGRSCSKCTQASGKDIQYRPQEIANRVLRRYTARSRQTRDDK